MTKVPEGESSYILRPGPDGEYPDYEPLFLTDGTNHAGGVAKKVKVRRPSGSTSFLTIKLPAGNFAQQAGTGEMGDSITVGLGVDESRSLWRLVHNITEDLALRGTSTPLKESFGSYGSYNVRIKLLKETAGFDAKKCPPQVPLAVINGRLASVYVRLGLYTKKDESWLSFSAVQVHLEGDQVEVEQIMMS